VGTKTKHRDADLRKQPHVFGGRERPILFSGPMVRAILEGRKTQTRRVIRDEWWRCLDPEDEDDRAAALAQCPYGKPGDRLWVRETHAQFAVGNRTGDAPQCVAYRASCDEDSGFDYVNNGDEIMRLKVTKWTPAIHMPRWAARLELRVTRVRIERLHDISDGDAIAEGCAGGHDAIHGYPFSATPREHFKHLWTEINGTKSWDEDPWVWVVGFTRLSPKGNG
jgi:hypothetical protein